MDLSEAARLMARQPKRRRYAKTCELCGTAFMSARPEARWCSVRCAQGAYVIRRREQRLRERQARQKDGGSTEASV